MDIHIDAGTHESVIRATLLRYTLKSRPVNVLVCGFRHLQWKTSGSAQTLNFLPDKGFTGASETIGLFPGESFHSPTISKRWE